MTPADRIREVLAAHGVDPGTCSLSGPRTLLGDVLDDAMEEHLGALVDATSDGHVSTAEAETLDRALVEHEQTIASLRAALRARR